MPVSEFVRQAVGFRLAELAGSAGRDAGDVAERGAALRLGPKDDEALGEPARKAWWPVFLGVLRRTSNVSSACREAGVSRELAYRDRRSFPEFAVAWEAAEEEALTRFTTTCGSERRSERRWSRDERGPPAMGQ